MTRRDAPSFYVTISPRGKPGEPVERVDMSTLVRSLKFKDDEKKADKVVLTISDHTQEQIDSGVWVQGQTIEFAFGYFGDLSLPRRAIIKKVKKSSPNTLQVEARAESVLLDREIESNTYENKTRSQVIQEIAEKHGYSGERVHIEDTEVVYPAISQGRMSDAQFCRHLANKEGFEFFIDFDGFHWHQRDFAQDAIRTLTYFSDLTGSIKTWSVDGDISGKPTRVRVKGRDPETKKDIDEEIGNSDDTSRPTLGGFTISVDPRTLERTRSVTPAAENTVREETQPTTETSADGAKRQARGRFRRAQTNAFKLKLTCEGDQELVAKSVVFVRGIGNKLSGRYYVSSAEHMLGQGYSMVLICKRDAVSSGEAIGGTAEQTAGKENSSKAPSNEKDDSLQPVINVDPRTQQRTITYEQTAGRRGQQGGS